MAVEDVSLIPSSAQEETIVHLRDHFYAQAWTVRNLFSSVPNLILEESFRKEQFHISMIRIIIMLTRPQYHLL